VNEAMQQQDFPSAIQMCAMALADFPDEPSLLRMKSLAEREAELLERRRFVQEQAMKAREFAEQGKHDVVVERMFRALQRYPGEPNLQALLDTSSAALARARDEQESASRLEEEREAWMRAWQSLSERCNELRRGLDENLPVDSLAGVVQNLNELMPTMSADDDARKLALPLLLEYETRRNARDKACKELEQLAQTRFTPETSLDPIETRLRDLVAAWPRDSKIEPLAKRVRQSIDNFKAPRSQETAKPAPPEVPKPKASSPTLAVAAAPAPKPTPALAQSAPVPSAPKVANGPTPPPAPVSELVGKIAPARQPLRLLWIGIAAVLVIAFAALAIWKLTRPAALVEVRAESDPSGATVHLADQTCTTPCALRVKPGSYAATAELIGYNRDDRTIEAQSNTTAAFRLTAAVPPASASTTQPTPEPAASAAPAPATPSPTAENPPAPSAPAPVTEQEAWQTVKDSRNIADVRRFVQHYPRGAHQSQAKAKLEDMVWRAALAAHTPAAVQGYLHEYPAGFYASDANLALSRMEWESQTLQSSTDAARLQDFAHRYPAGEFHDRALARIDDLRWAEVHTDDPASLRAYLEHSPTGRHARRARPHRACGERSCRETTRCSCRPARHRGTQEFSD
jgi:hypothetical protein